MGIRVFLSAIIVVALSVFFFLLLNKSGSDWWWLKWNSDISKPGFVDVLVTNAFIYTSDPSLPFADCMAIRNGRILRLGNFSSLQELGGYSTEKLNLEGKVVVPGFVDSHVHLISGGLQMAQVELRGVNTKAEFIRKVKEAVKTKQPGSWVLGGGWNNDLWGGDLPAASWVEDITPHNPVWLSRMDGHMALANSLALHLANVTRETKDPPGGTIVRRTDKDPTGLLIDAAMQLMHPNIPEISIIDRREALLRASNYALTKGVTTVVDVGRYIPGTSAELPWEDFKDVYRWADSSGNMRIRVCLFFPLVKWSHLADLVRNTGRVISEWMYLGGLKAFVDGSLGSNSALFFEPYADDPQNYGLQVTDIDSLFNMTASADKTGLQVAIHAIGDKANDLILELYQSVASANGQKDRRFRIEHAQHLAPGTAARFGEDGVITSVQPAHLLDDADSAIKKLGKERAEKGSYLFRSLLSSNAVLAFGSDWPVADIDPLRNIMAAVNRIPVSWETSWIPSERVTFTDALDAHTISAARSCFLDDHVGSLSVGKLADFVILSTNSWSAFMDGRSAAVEATYVGGVQAYPFTAVN